MPGRKLISLCFCESVGLNDGEISPILTLLIGKVRYRVQVYNS